MIEFFALIGALMVIWLCFVGYIKFTNSRDSRLNHLCELYTFEHYSHRYNYPYSKIKKFFKENPEEIKRREEIWQEKLKEEHAEEERKRKQQIIGRIFAYDYEDTLFEIYAPYAEKRGETWVCNTWLPKNEVISKIATIRRISKLEAEDIAKQLEEHWFLWENKYSYMIPSDSNWNILSDTDMNLDKWITKRENNLKIINTIKSHSR